MATAKKPAPPPAPILEGLQLLVVEDDHEILRMIALVVGGAGAEVATASSALEAYALLGSQRFDVVVLDWNLTDVAGSEFVGRLQHEFSIPGRRTLVVTGDLVRSNLEHEAAGLGCRVLAKPFKPDALIENVAELAGRRSAHS